MDKLYTIYHKMAFSPICSVVYALGLVRLISRCYAVPQCSTHQFVDPVRIPLHPCVPCSHLHHRCCTGRRSVHVAPLCAYRSTTSAFRLRHVIWLPSSPIILEGFLVTSVVSFDMLLIIFLDPLSGEDKF